MSRFKGKFVALLTIEFNVKLKPYDRPFEEIEEDIQNGVLADLIRAELEGEIGEDDTVVTVEQQCADLYEVDDDGDT